MTLQRYLTRLIWLCILPVLVLAIGIGYLQFDEVRDGEAERAQRLAQLLATNIDRALEARMAGLRVLTHSPAFDEAARWGDLRRQAHEFRESFGGDVIVVDADRRLVLHTSVAPGATLPPLPQPVGRAAVPLALETGQPAIGDPVVDPLGTDRAVAVAMPVTTESQGTMALANVVPVHQLAKLANTLVLPPNWQVVVHDSMDQVMLSRGVADGPPSGPEGLALRFAEMPTRVPWRVEVRIPRATYAQQLASVGAVLVLALLAVIALSYFVGRWGTRRLTHSVRSLVDIRPPGPAPPSDIEEIRDARHVLDEALREREAAAQALRLRDEQLGRIFESTPDAIITVDEQQVIVMANPAAARVFGRPVEQFVGAALASLIPERLRLQHQQHVETFGRDGPGPRSMAARMTDVFGLRADGQMFPIEASISQVHVGAQRLYTAILRDVTERRHLEESLRASHADLARLVIAQQTMREQERKRIARELHDELQQVLAAIKMDAGAMEQSLGGDPARLAPLIARIDRLASSAITSSRRIVNDLRPQALEDLGLVPALEVLARQFAERTGIAVTVDSDERCRTERAVPDAIALCLYRAAQEGLNNVSKHARAMRVGIDVRARAEGGWVLRLRDDGRGLQPGDRQKPYSFGLRGLSERVQALGGALSVDKEPGPGVTLVVEI